MTDAVNRGWRFAAQYPEVAFDRATAPFSDSSSSWQRPWTWADTIFVGLFVGGAVALGALTWNAVSYRRG